MLSKMVQLPIMVVIALAPAARSIKINSCVVGAVDAAYNPYDGATVCEYPLRVSSKLDAICGTQINQGMSVFSKMCKAKGTPIVDNHGTHNSTTVPPAMATVTKVITMGAAPVPMTTVVIPVETRTYTFSIVPMTKMNGSKAAAVPTTPGLNATAVTSVASGHAASTSKHGSGLVVEPNTEPLVTTSSAAAAATAAESVSSSAIAALFMTGDAGPVALALGGALLAAW